MSATIGIDELRVGMFVHLDLGWWQHPFALSSFVVQSEDQIATIRRLGLKRLRWSPDKSLPAEAAEPPLAGGAAGAGLVLHPAAAAGAVAERADAPVSVLAGVPGAVPTGVPGAVPTGVPAVVLGGAPRPGDAGLARALAPPARQPEPPPPQPPAGPLAAALAGVPAPAATALQQQREAQAQCEQQYGEAGAACRVLFGQVLDEPHEARRTGEALTRALLDKMLVDGEMCVRTLALADSDPVAGHALNVTVIALLLGRVFGLDAAEMTDLGLGALLHDVGKFELPERARQAEQAQTPAEIDLYRDHVAHGVVVARRMGLGDGAVAVLAQHHEMADGSGFPQQLTLERLSLGARIVALVNRYDNLCNPLKPAQALTPHEAVSRLFTLHKGQFDSTLLNAFIRMMGVYPPGSLVQLTDERYAAVVSCNSSRPLKPRVLVADLAVPREEALLLDLDRLPDLGIRRSLRPQLLPPAVHGYLAPRARMVYFFEPAQAPAQPAAQVLAA